MHLDWWDGRSRQVFPLDGPRAVLGSSTGCDVVVAEPSVSRVHALLQQVGDTWFVEDCGSRNGTTVNGRRVTGLTTVRPGDEIRLGRAALRLGGAPRPPGSVTEGVAARPATTAREHDVLVALCAPLAAGDVFTEPASVREMAAALVVTEAAVKQHLASLYDKFGVDPGDRRRSRLANAALDSGAVTLADLRVDG